MTKSEQAYNLKCEGMSNSEIASILGVKKSSVPTLAKGHMESHGMPHWGGIEKAEAHDSGHAHGQSKSHLLMKLIGIRDYMKTVKSDDEDVMRIIGDIHEIINDAYGIRAACE